MSDFKLSSQGDWRKHWGKHELVRVIPENFSWHDSLKKAANEIDGTRCSIELGGFPGNFSVYLKKYCGFDVALIDYLVDHNVINQLFAINGLKAENDVTVIDADVFSFVPQKKYSLVCSFGLVEHFTDLKSILACHLKFMQPNGILLVTLPNFKGVNGLLQRLFDPENLAIHNLKVMDLMLLEKTLLELGMVNVDVQYYPSTQVWLEGLRYRSLILRLLVRVTGKTINLLSIVFGKKNKYFSNSIVISARLRSS